MKRLFKSALVIALSATFLTSCNDDDDATVNNTGDDTTFTGAVYAMSNGNGQVNGNEQGANTIVAYGRGDDGNLTLINTFPTGGNGGDYDGGEGLDPLISAYALTKTSDNEFLLAVNAGSNTITSFSINDDFSLTNVSTEETEAIGPNSIAVIPSDNDGVNSLVYVSNITRQEFLAGGEPMQQGTLIGYWLLDDGTLQPIAGSSIDLPNRPSAVHFSPNGEYLVAASINAGAVALGSGNQDELRLYNVNSDGTLTFADGTTSTLRDNTERLETIFIGTNELLGKNPEKIPAAFNKLFLNKWKKGGIPDLWDGKAAKRIINNLLKISTVS